MWSVLVTPALHRPEETEQYKREHINCHWRWVVWNPDGKRDPYDMFCGNWEEMRPACYYVAQPSGVT